jgi:hypothetical protein
VSDGWADRVTRSATPRRPALPAPRPLGTGDYDLVVGDLLYSQLLYPALKDLELPTGRIGAILREAAPPLTDHVVARLQLSAPRGVVVHLHDALGWWDGREQPVALDEILAAARESVASALELVAKGNGPAGCDPRDSLARFGVPVLETRLWRWPFQAGVEYLICATVASGGLCE